MLGGIVAGDGPAVAFIMFIYALATDNRQAEKFMARSERGERANMGLFVLDRFNTMQIGGQGRRGNRYSWGFCNRGLRAAHQPLIIVNELVTRTSTIILSLNAFLPDSTDSKRARGTRCGCLFFFSCVALDVSGVVSAVDFFGEFLLRMSTPPVKTPMTSTKQTRKMGTMKAVWRS